MLFVKRLTLKLLDEVDKMKKIVSLIVGLLLVVSSLFGCSNSEESNSGSWTDIVLYENNSSEYKIVLPKESTEWEQFAADELQLFFKQATSFELPIITDAGLEFSEEDKFLSVGETSLYEESGVQAEFEELGRDGYKIVRKGNTVILVGSEGYGHINAVYGFLRQEVDFRAYAQDELYTKRVSELKLYDFNLTDVPDIGARAGLYYFAGVDAVFATRQRTLSNHGGQIVGGDDLWGTWSHTYHQLLPKETYEAAHPEWYSGSGGEQLCLSNQELRDEMKKVVKERILSKPNAQYFMIGQMDKNSYCKCENCMARIKVVTVSGLMMEFINEIAEEIEVWQKTACPNRTITIVTFAYLATKDAPVKQAEDGTLVPLYDSLKARKNVSVMVAPIGADWRSPLNDEEHNKSSKIMFEGWSAISDDISCWSYSANFDMNLEYFDYFEALAQNYKYFRDCGVSYLIDECNSSQRQDQAFQVMLGYVHSELMWNCDSNIYDLVYDFMDHYYKEASEPMKQYFNLLTGYVSQRKAEFCIKDNTYYGTDIWSGTKSETKTVMNKDFWSIQILEQMIGLFDQAYQIIEENYVGEMKDTMIKRLKIESLTPRMYLLELFWADINKDEYLSMVDEFEKDCLSFGISYVYRSSGTLTADCDRLRKKVSN